MVHPGSSKYDSETVDRARYRTCTTTYTTASTVAKPYFDEQRCTILVDTYYTVPVIVTTVFLKMSPQVRNMYCRIHCKRYSNPCTGLDRSWGLQEVEAPSFQDNRHMKVVRFSALRTGRLYLQQIFLVRVYLGDRGSTVVKVLCYKSEGRWFDPSWCHWNFSLT